MPSLTGVLPRFIAQNLIPIKSVGRYERLITAYKGLWLGKRFPRLCFRNHWRSVKFKGIWRVCIIYLWLLKSLVAAVKFSGQIVSGCAEQSLFSGVYKSSRSWQICSQGAFEIIKTFELKWTLTKWIRDTHRSSNH